ncbi:hypothetical protein SO802_027333 [Lithocarpus litseifolius]|uniref:Uncharacterized protein n=1 Tax=Lithocarpus litseifolius TaxID=425828 RepID=A0AAW2C332_9ROSI
MTSPARSKQTWCRSDPCSTSVVPADEESKGSDSSSSSEDSLKVHDGSADGRADASPRTPATRIESPAASDSGSPRYQKWEDSVVGQSELHFWHKQIREAFQDALKEIDPCGRYGKISTEHLFDALHLNRGGPITVGEMEKRGSCPAPIRAAADVGGATHGEGRSSHNEDRFELDEDISKLDEGRFEHREDKSGHGKRRFRQEHDKVFGFDVFDIQSEFAL